MSPADLKAFAEVMVEMRILRVSGSTSEDSEDFTIEMDPSAFSRGVQAASPLPPEREPTHEEIAFASSIPVTDAERNGRDP